MPDISSAVRSVKRPLAIAKSGVTLADDSERAYKNLLQQAQDEYETAWWYCRPKIKEWLVRLKLYNNQKRDKDRVGDPMLFTVHQTVLASLYEDRLSVSMGPREEGDMDVADNLTKLAEVDFDEMCLDEHDYEWDFDATAFGRGLSYFNEFDRDTKTPLPEVWDPITFLRDPDAKSVNGNRLGNGAMRYGGREVSMSREEMEENDEYFNLGKLKEDSQADKQSLIGDARQARDAAQGRENVNLQSKKTKGPYRVLQWFTIIGGEKHLVCLANNRTLIIRVTRLENRDGEPVKYWPIIDRVCYPISHDWDGVSVWDIIEDKQRFRAALLNVYGDSARADLYPMYLYNEDKIGRQIDKSFGFNKWIPVTGDISGAAAPLQKSQPSTQAAFIMNFLDVAAQKALATPELAQGVPSSEKRTLGELQMVSSSVNTRFSLSAKIFGWSERRRWRRWYEIYDRDFEQGVESKILRVSGPFGYSWRKLRRQDIITKSAMGPDIAIESKKVSEAQKLVKYNQLSGYLGQALLLGGADRLYGLRNLGRLVLPKDEVERILPLTVDERQAKRENISLGDGDAVEVHIDEDHNAHLRVHAMSLDTPAKAAHIKAHETAILRMRQMPAAFPQQTESNFIPKPGQPERPQQIASQGMETGAPPQSVNAESITPAAQ